MINPEKRSAIWLLHNQGTAVRQISRLFKVDRNTVREIIKNRGQMPDSIRSDHIVIDEELLIGLHGECDGYIQRVYEKLAEEHGIEIGDSTLSRKVRHLDLGEPKNQRCGQVADEPGAEMQHDTTVYTRVRLGGSLTRLVASMIYLRFSKLRYLKFFRSFNRFKMKGFLHEALMFWQHGAPNCIIDNTNLARLRGIGKNAVIVAEMEQFARHYSSNSFAMKEVMPTEKPAMKGVFSPLKPIFFQAANSRTSRI